MLRGDGYFSDDVAVTKDRTSEDRLASHWPRIREKLRAELGEAVYTSWFGRLEPIAMSSLAAEFSVPTKFLKTWVSAHYAGRILSHLKADFPALERVVISVRATGAPAVRLGSRQEAPPVRMEPPAASRQPVAMEIAVPAPVRTQTAVDGLESSPLDRRMTFDSFMQAKSNALAYAAAQQVARTAGGSAPIYNPLFLHSAVGLGKTHLAQAIAHAVESAGRRVIYLTAERFMYGFVSALKAQTAIAFKEKLRGIDLLVIDDVQFLHGKSIQQEFCHTLNALLDSGRQVIIAGDRPPSDLEALDERVRSRLSGGLAVEIGALDDDLRVRILEARIQAARQNFPEFQVPAPVVAHIAGWLPRTAVILKGLSIACWPWPHSPANRSTPKAPKPRCAISSRRAN